MSRRYFSLRFFGKVYQTLDNCVLTSINMYNVFAINYIKLIVDGHNVNIDR